MWVARRALGAPLRPPFVASLLSPASAPPLGPDGLPTCDFLNCIYDFGNIMLLSKNACYSAKSMLLSQKQRRYTYDSIVYAPTLMLLTILYILQLIIKAYLSFEQLIYSMNLTVWKFVGQGPVLASLTNIYTLRWNIHLI